MNTTIKSRVEAILEAYKQTMNGYLAEIKGWETNQLYMADYRSTKIKEVKLKMQASDDEFNKKLVGAIADEKASIESTKADKPSDYQVQVSNALKIIEMSGDSITDELAYDIMKPIQGDFLTMKLISGILRKHASDSCRVTLSRLTKFEHLKSLLDNLERFAIGFFNNGYYLVNSLSFILRDQQFKVTVDEIESLVNELNREMQTNYKEAEAVIEQELREKMWRKMIAGNTAE